MKKIYGVLLLTLMLMGSSCKQDEAILPQSLQNTLLLGKWYLSQLDVTTQEGNNTPVTAPSVTGFSDKDYYIFAEGNKATFSSTLYARIFEGYYSYNTGNTPTLLSFKSGDLLIRYTVIALQPDSLVIEETITDTLNGVRTITTNRYTYIR
jgi:hypothetical protein